MKTIIKHITEDVVRFNKKLESAYELSGNPNRKRCPKNLRSYKHNHEYIRGYFGDNESSTLDSVKKMLKGIGVDLDSIYLEYGMFWDASGQYNAVKITSKDNINIPKYGFNLNKNDYIYIINTTVGNSKIRRKTLTPDNLGLTNIVFNNKEDIVKAVKKGLKSSQLEEYTQAILSICNCINTNDNNNTLEDILNSETIYIVDKSTLGDLTDSDFNNISNDFGEVLCPLMLMDKLQGNVNLSYPTGSNAKLYDYIINDNIWISAKAGKGSVPSSVDTMKCIQSKFENLVNDNIIDISKLQTKEKEFLEEIVPIIADDEKNESGSAIRRQTWRLAIKINELGYSNIKNALNILTKYNLTISENGISEKEIDNIYKENKLNDLLTEFYTNINYKPSKRFSINKLVNNYYNLEKKIKEGMILYPLKTIITRFINDNYGKGNNEDYISKYANMVMTGYQMYFNYKIDGNNIKLTFCPKQMSKHNFQLKQQGSVGNPLLKSMGIEMIK